MDVRMWIRVVVVIHLLQDFLVCRVYSMPPSATCDHRHYQVGAGTDARCCVKCRPGERLTRHCLPGEPNSTQCQECKPGQFQPEASGQRACRRCTPRPITGHRILLSNCTKTTDRKYGACVKGYFYDRSLDACFKCESCKPGYGVVKQCSTYKDTECAECKEGWFSDQTSQTQRCRRTDNNTTPSSSATNPVSTDVDYGPPTAGENSNSHSWMMPFFISAVALLLVLFLVVAIGVGIWCLRHSKQPHPDSVVVESHATTAVEGGQKAEECYIEEARWTLLPKEENRYQVVKVHKGIRENGMMLRDVSHDVIEELANYLNPTNTPNNWKKVACKLGFTWSIINNLALNPTRTTQELLGRWGTKRDATVYTLYRVLKDIERDDAADVLERLLREPSPSCPKSV